MKRIIVFGASLCGTTFLSRCEKSFDILAFSDNDKSKQGCYISDYKIIPPEEIVKLDYDFIVVAVSLWAPQVRKQLIGLGIPENKIFVLPKNYDLNLNLLPKPFECNATKELARKMVVFLAQTLKNKGIMYFVDFGTLLGIVRDGDIMSWDDDVDISVNTEDAESVIETVKNVKGSLPMQNELQWNCFAHYTKDNKPCTITFEYENNQSGKYKQYINCISFRFFKDGKSWHPTGQFGAPEVHFRKSSQLKFKGAIVSVPYDYESYLTYQYGDWKQIVKEKNYANYKNYDYRQSQNIVGEKKVFLW